MWPPLPWQEKVVNIDFFFCIIYIPLTSVKFQRNQSSSNGWNPSKQQITRKNIAACKERVRQYSKISKTGRYNLWTAKSNPAFPTPMYSGCMACQGSARHRWPIRYVIGSAGAGI